MAGRLFGACQAYLAPTEWEQMFLGGKRPGVAIMDHMGPPSSDGVLNWGDMVDGENDLWIAARGAML